MTNHETLLDLLNKELKVVYNEFDSVQIGKGVLIKVDSEFLKLKGDHTTQVIPISRIIKVSCVNQIKESRQDGRKQK